MQIQSVFVLYKDDQCFHECLLLLYMITNSRFMKFEKLVSDIQHTSLHLQQNAVKAVNIQLTLRNWLIGFFIVEFEQKGIDRASYGSNLLQNLSEKLSIKGLTTPELSRCRQFYQIYPDIWETLVLNFGHLFPPSILGTVSQESSRILGSLTQEFQESNNQKINTYHFNLIVSTSYTHFVELIKIEDSTKRKFYELLILKTTPSVRQLKRQIETLAFERTGLSSNTELAFEELHKKITPEETIDIIKSHYFFEFLNLNAPNLIEESELEQALIENLQQFILELGNGFCFENRQKRILIGDEYFFIDLVFYHRILKCHVIVELKTEKANHGHIGQLKTYINYFKKKIMQPNDNPPVGILLVTDQNRTMVEYAVADGDKDLFVSEYLLQLPQKEEIENFINNELKNL